MSKLDRFVKLLYKKDRFPMYDTCNIICVSGCPWSGLRYGNGLEWAWTFKQLFGPLYQQSMLLDKTYTHFVGRWNQFGIDVYVGNMSVHHACNECICHITLHVKESPWFFSGSLILLDGFMTVILVIFNVKLYHNYAGKVMYQPVKTLSVTTIRIVTYSYYYISC